MCLTKKILIKVLILNNFIVLVLVIGADKSTHIHQQSKLFYSVFKNSSPSTGVKYCVKLIIHKFYLILMHIFHN